MNEIKELFEKFQKLDKLRKAEFVTAVGIYVFVLLVFMTDARKSYSDLDAPNRALFDQANLQFSFYRNYFFPVIAQFTIVFLAFMAINFKLAPKLVRGEAIAKNLILVILTYILSGAGFCFTRSFTKAHFLNNEQPILALVQSGFSTITWLFFTFGIYTAIKYTGVYLLSNSEKINEKYQFIKREALAAFVIWLFSMFLLYLLDAEGDLIIFWGMLIPSAILLYSWSQYSLIPKALAKKRPFFIYMLQMALILFALFLVTTFILLISVVDEDAAFIFSVLNAFFQFIFTAPLSWVIFKRQMTGKEEVYELKKELGQTHANFDFLRSQINPHFLFNALNTIYGTAIQEKAERTSEGIEKLGDMMRFMLQENMQEKIPLAREIDYLNNYIDLQKLRTDPNPNVRISISIEQPTKDVQISPMLLIPFVENAFKHGISLREYSHIGISLEVKDKTLHFDVHNSKHEKQESDPERFKSGIGLSNVKQRLQLLYAGKHELMIRETTKEFFVHLIIQLT